MIGATVRRGAAVVLVAVGVVALGACGSDATVKETKDGKVTVHGDGDKATVTVDGENGTAVTFNQQKVPSDFPSDVPLPEHVKLRNATSGTRSAKQFFQLSYALGSASALKTIGAYATRLSDAGFTVDRTDAPGTDAVPTPLVADGKGWHVVALATDGGSGSLTVTVSSA